MTAPKSLLSVRLSPELSEALNRHCAHTGETRSSVVQQSVAQYLLAESGLTLGSLAEAILPPLKATSAQERKAPRQKRFRDYVREKRRR